VLTYPAVMGDVEQSGSLPPWDIPARRRRAAWLLVGLLGLGLFMAVLTYSPDRSGLASLLNVVNLVAVPVVAACGWSAGFARLRRDLAQREHRQSPTRSSLPGWVYALPAVALLGIGTLARSDPTASDLMGQASFYGLAFLAGWLFGASSRLRPAKPEGRP